MSAPKPVVGTRPVAVAAFAQSPSLRRVDQANEVEMLMPVISEVFAKAKMTKDDIDFICSGSTDYLIGGPFSFVMALDAIGVWPPKAESHVEMDAAWALYEAWVQLQEGHIDTALVYGFGKIGAEIARLARLLGMRVIGMRRNAAPHAHADEMHTPDHLHAMLARSDWLALACPLTKETRGVINAAALTAMPEGARVINISRGEVIDEPALIDALASRHLGGAYLDVFAQEPLPAESPLWDMPHVLVTAHDASTSNAYDPRINALFLDNLARWQRSEPLINEVTQL